MWFLVIGQHPACRWMCALKLIVGLSISETLQCNVNELMLTSLCLCKCQEIEGSRWCPLMLDSSTFRVDTGDYAQSPWSHSVVMVKCWKMSFHMAVWGCKHPRLEAVTQQSFQSDVYPLRPPPAPRWRRTRLHPFDSSCSRHHSQSPGPRPSRLRRCKHPTLSCDPLRQRLREGCLLELAGSDTLAWSEPSERRQGPRSRATGSSSQLFQTARKRL